MSSPMFAEPPSGAGDRAGTIRVLLAGPGAAMRGSLLAFRDGIEVVGAAATDADTISLAGRQRPSALRLAPSRVVRERLASITAAEHDAIALAARGRTDHEIAAQLSLGAATVRSRLSSAMRKLGVRD